MDRGTPSWRLRPADPTDRPVLAGALALAADWRPGARPRSVDEVLAEPSLAHYVTRWGGDGDAGVVAVDADDRPLGATWWRFLPADDPGYGFVDEATPEVAIGVVPEARSRGVGSALLDALVTEARRRSLPALSLSVEQDNPAVALYRRLGFVPVATVDGSITMVLDLAPGTATAGAHPPTGPAPYRLR
jgi:ribosomal protein S18 acetylase RimI-like enzyme